MHCDRLADDEAIGNKFADGIARIGVGDFALFIGVQPDLALAATDDGGRQALLCAQVWPMIEY